MSSSVQAQERPSNLLNTFAAEVAHAPVGVFKFCGRMGSCTSGSSRALHHSLYPLSLSSAVIDFAERLGLTCKASSSALCWNDSEKFKSRLAALRLHLQSRLRLLDEEEGIVQPGGLEASFGGYRLLDVRLLIIVRSCTSDINY